MSDRSDHGDLHGWHSSRPSQTWFHGACKITSIQNSAVTKKFKRHFLSKNVTSIHDYFSGFSLWRFSFVLSCFVFQRTWHESRQLNSGDQKYKRFGILFGGAQPWLTPFLYLNSEDKYIWLLAKHTSIKSHLDRQFLQVTLLSRYLRKKILPKFLLILLDTFSAKLTKKTDCNHPQSFVHTF